MIKPKYMYLVFAENDSCTPEINKTISSGKVLDVIINSAWNSVDPGLLFWDNMIFETL